MNIWIVNHYASVPGKAHSTRHYSLARALSRLGHRVSIFCSGFDHSLRRSILPPHTNVLFEDANGVQMIWLRTPAYSGSRTLARAWNIVRFTGAVLRVERDHPDGAPDIVVGSSQHLLACWAAARIAKRYGVPFVFEVRDLMPETLVEVGGMPRWHPAVVASDLLTKLLYRKASLILSLLPGAGGYMVGQGAKPELIEWLPNGIDLQVAGAPVPPMAKGPFTVMYAGALGIANDVETMLEAALELQRRGCKEGEMLLRFVGDGPEKETLMARAEREGARLVRFEAAVPKQRIYEVLSTADVFLISSKGTKLHKWGISPNKLFDYLGCARPVIFGFDIPYNPIEDSGAGKTIPPGDPVAMADAILQLRDCTAQERWEMGLRGRELVEKEYSYERLGEKLELLLNSVLRGRSSATFVGGRE